MMGGGLSVASPGAWSYCRTRYGAGRRPTRPPDSQAVPLDLRLRSQDSVSVPTMRCDEHLPTAFTEQYQAVELPYAGGALSTVIIMPTDLTNFEATVTADTLDAVYGALRDGAFTCPCPNGQAAPTSA